MIWRYSSSAGVACACSTDTASERTTSARPGRGYAAAVRLGNDTRALVTGASRGIGRAVAEELLGRGATVGLISRNPEALSGNSIPLAADVGDRGQVEDAVTRFVAEAGGIDVLVANAGVAYYGPFRDASVEEAEEMTRV